MTLLICFKFIFVEAEPHSVEAKRHFNRLISWIVIDFVGAFLDAGTNEPLYHLYN